MKGTFHAKSTREPRIIVIRNRFGDESGSLDEKYSDAEEKIVGPKGIADEKEDHLTATYWG